MRIGIYTPLDQALESLGGYGIELSNGNSNHAPMVAETLCAMGRPDAVMPWIERYRGRMTPRPASVGPIRREDWHGALGQRQRFTDWAGFFGEELAQTPWTQLLDLWVNRLAPGFCAAATHGVIRVGHAVRGLNAGETPPRLSELADALASWAATYQELPTIDPVANGAMTPRQAITRIPVFLVEDRSSVGNITTALATLADLPGFAETIGLIDVCGAIAPLLSELSETFAGVYLANAHDIRTTIAFIHGVTSIAALGNIVPHVGDATARIAARYAWQSACGLYACFGGETILVETIESLSGGDDDRRIDRAVRNGDEHVIKFTEACLSRNALNPSSTYLAAADHVLSILKSR